MITTFPPTLGANPGRARSHNRQLVLAAVRKAGTAGRAEIARHSGLSTQAVSNIIADLLSEGLLCERGQRSAGRGMPVQQYAIQPGGGHGLGFEIRPHALFSALVDLTGTPIYSHRSALHDTSPTAVAEALRQAQDTALAQCQLPGHRLLGAGIVMPGPFGTTGLQSMGSELPGWGHTDPGALFSEALDLPVVVENDANAAAMAEHVSGAARGLSSFAYLYFGRGLGLGLIQNGQLIRGAFGNAGEIGHIPMQAAGRTRLLEDCVSRMSVERHMRAAGHLVETIEDLDALHAVKATGLRDWLNQAAATLGPALGIVENLFDPQTVVLGGAMPEGLLDCLIARVRLPDRSVAQRADRTHPRLVRGTCGRMTATLGAAAMVLNQSLPLSLAMAR